MPRPNLLLQRNHRAIFLSRKMVGQASKAKKSAFYAHICGYELSPEARSCQLKFGV